MIEIAVGGKSAGQVFEGDRRFELIVRLPEATRKNLTLLKRIPISLPEDFQTHPETVSLTDKPDARQNSNYIPLGSVADFKIVIGPNHYPGRTAPVGFNGAGGALAACWTDSIRY